MSDRRQHDPFHGIGKDMPPITDEKTYEIVKDLMEHTEGLAKECPPGDARRHLARYASRLRERVTEYEAGQDPV